MTHPRHALGQRPSKPGVSGLIYDYRLRANVGRNHAYVEGIEVNDQAVNRGFDRAEHPWLHGRRGYDTVERLREVIARVG